MFYRHFCLLIWILRALKFSTERKVYMCNHATYHFKFHVIISQEVWIMQTFGFYVFTLVIVFG